MWATYRRKVEKLQDSMNDVTNMLEAEMTKGELMAYELALLKSRMEYLKTVAEVVPEVKEALQVAERENPNVFA
jgi:hypothetical protein